MFLKNCYQLEVKSGALRLVNFRVLCTTEDSGLSGHEDQRTDGQENCQYVKKEHHFF
jgi:hypothetical protein